MKIFGQHDEQTITQFEHVRERAVDAALMADGHVGYVVPIGGVVAYDNKVSAVGPGFDIGCGNCAIRTDMKVEELADAGMSLRDIASNPHAFRANRRVIKLADEIAASISFGIGRANKADDAPVDHPLFLDPAWYAIPNEGRYRDDLREMARRQLGTVGGGNHYVDVLADEEGFVWVGVHFGSRGLGHKIASNFIALSQGGRWGERAKEVEVLMPLDQPLGHDYWQLMNLAGQYAYAGREWVTRKVVQIIGANEIEMVHNHHNFGWSERHRVRVDDSFEERDLIVVRKGATPAFPGQKGFVGGSMGDDAVIVQGVTPDTAPPEVQAAQREALFSTVHGAGRIMSRTQAAGKRNRKTGQILSPGRVTPEMMQSWVKEKGVILRGGGLDESPHVYRRLPEVLAAQEGTVEVLHTLRPLIVVMAPAEEFDPYKD